MVKKRKKTKRKAVRNIITGEIEFYTNTKTVGLRDPFTGEIRKRITKEKAKKRGALARTFTIWDEIESSKQCSRFTQQINFEVSLVNFMVVYVSYFIKSLRKIFFLIIFTFP